MVVQEFCVKKVARSQKAGQQWSIWKYCSCCMVLQDLCVKKRSRGHKKLVSSGAQRADRRGRQLKSSGMMNSNCLPWTPQFFTEPDQPRSSQIFQDAETVIFSCEDTPEEAFQICCMTTTRNVVLLWSSLWFYSPFYLPFVTSSKCSIWSVHSPFSLYFDLHLTHPRLLVLSMA